ncbi:MAG: PilT/PilU family type 4a pilus ATPase [Candidatus Eremiobacteraeota bacterium]|nr:PilT/PilU family type 4a pilus ATPase [Candidatus Eremiobacteraeota bacterium]
MSEVLAAVRIDEVLRLARARGASDVHLCPNRPPALRIDGVLETQSTTPTHAREIENISTVLLGPTAIDRLADTGDATGTFRDDRLGSFRVHAYRVHQGLALAVRLLAQSVPTLESLHLPFAVDTFADKPTGLVIFSGPTGSGKSTAMAGLMDRVNRNHAKHILTIEDPIEYEHVAMRSTIGQREIGRDVSTFAEAIVGALRSDPDVLLVGEMRDAGTMRAAVTAAETGHLVLTTLHTGDAPQTIDRIVNAFAGSMQEQIRVALAQTLVGVVCLRLVPRTCGGRRAAAEVLIATDAVRAIIRDGKTHQLRNVIATGRQAGMHTLETHLSELVMRGEITVESARRHAERPVEVRVLERPAVA